jgi:hypothetical protein
MPRKVNSGSSHAPDGTAAATGASDGSRDMDAASAMAAEGAEDAAAAEAAGGGGTSAPVVAAFLALFDANTPVDEDDAPDSFGSEGSDDDGFADHGGYEDDGEPGWPSSQQQQQHAARRQSGMLGLSDAGNVSGGRCQAARTL